MYQATTHNIRVSVEARYIEEQSQPEENRYVWAYTITIVNMGSETVQLQSRHWEITDGNGFIHEVEGEGVVGQKPVLNPGDAFEYTSGCPLPTPFGAMTGHYLMVDNRGQQLTVAIPAFPLESPHMVRTLN